MTAADQLVPCALCVKYRDDPAMVPKPKGGYPLCVVCASFMRSSDGWEPCCGPHGRGCSTGLTMPLVGGKRCAPCQATYESRRGGAVQ